jgi:hypothetical protein
MHRTTRFLVGLGGSLALLAGAAACGDDDDTGTPAAETSVDAGFGDDGLQEPTDDGVNLPDPGTDDELVAGCERLDERPDGVYAVGDAGEIEIDFDGTTVRVVEARPAEGWTASEDDEDDDDEVEVTFSGDDRAIEFEAEVDDGRLEIEVCESTR